MRTGFLFFKIFSGMGAVGWGGRARSPYVAQASLKLQILLPQTSKGWDYKRKKEGRMEGKMIRHLLLKSDLLSLEI